MLFKRLSKAFLLLTLTFYKFLIDLNNRKRMKISTVVDKMLQEHILQKQMLRVQQLASKSKYENEPVSDELLPNDNVKAVIKLT